MQHRLRLKLGLSFICLSLSSAAAVFVIQAWLGDADTARAWSALAVGIIALGGGSALASLLASQVQALSQFAGRVSRGDLSQFAQFERSSALPDEVDDVAHAVNFMLQTARELVAHIHDTANAVSRAAAGLSTTAFGVDKSTAEVVATIEEIAVGAEAQTELVARASRIMTDIAGGIERTTRAAEDAAVASNETATVAQSGGAVGKNAVDKLRKVFEKIEVTGERVVRFGEKSKEISKIVEVITKLSQQTNLLALNATIEAARAGDYGRGFAVVADEIRKLAENSAGSADQIGKLIEESVGEARSATAAMQESTAELNDGREDMNSIIRSLENITGTALKGVDVVGQISRITGAQLQGAQEMVAAMNDISEVAARNARATEKLSSAIGKQATATRAVSSSATGLTKLSQDLESVVTRFQMGRESQGAV